MWAALALLALATLPAASADGVAEALAAAVAAADGDSSPTRRVLWGGFKLREQDSYALELLFAAFLFAYSAVAVRGRRANQRLALAHAEALLRAGGALDRNFAAAAAGDATLIKEGPDTFKVYASGRRGCQGALVTLRLAPRHDLLAGLTGASAPDAVDIEIALAEDAMASLVLYVAAPAALRSTGQPADVRLLARRLEAGRDLAGWPGALAVFAEHAPTFQELMAPQLMDAAFGAAAWAELGSHFRFLHASSDYGGAARPAAVGEAARHGVVRVGAALPPPGAAADSVVERLISLACLMVDALCVYKLSPEQAKRAAEARRRAGAAEDAPTPAEEAAKRAEALRERKEADEKERLKKLAPEAAAKERARLERIERARRAKKMAKLAKR
jgi:hypothetical protein